MNVFSRAKFKGLNVSFSTVCYVDSKMSDFMSALVKNEHIASNLLLIWGDIDCQHAPCSPHKLSVIVTGLFCVLNHWQENT